MIPWRIMIFGGPLRIGNLMNKTLWFAFLLFLMLLLKPASALPGQIILDADDQFEFAQQLMERGEYQGAVGEFQRFIHFFPEDEKVPKAHYLIGVSYLRARKYETARKVLGEVYKNYSNRPLSGKALLLIGESYYRQGISGEAAHYFERVIKEYPQPELKNAAIYRLGWSRMQSNNWREASKTFETVEKSSPLFASAQELSEESLKGELLPYKNPTTAGVLAVIPGLGHVYSNRYKDGLVAFLLNGLFIWAAVEAFDEDLNVLGGMLLFLELGWYTGNIYSAVNTAHKYNRKARNDFRQSLPDRLNLNLFTTKDGLGVALKIDF
jgi:tol-pal system protein YbgF